MSSSLIELAQVLTHEQAFGAFARMLGFATAGDIERFLFKAYGKAIRNVPSANRPKGAIFFLEPPAVDGALAQEKDLIPAIMRIQTDITSKIYSLRLDLAAGGTAPYDLGVNERKMMSGSSWSQRVAQMVSRQKKKCVVWADGVSAFVYLDGDIYQESADVVAELPFNVSRAASLLPWDDGALAFEFAAHELDDTSRAGIWCVPDKHLLCPKPELLMSRGLGKFLLTRMAGYWSHADEPCIDNSGRVDITLQHADGQTYLLEVKWTGRSLSSAYESKTKSAIATALKKKKVWFTSYDDSAFDTGITQVKIYFASNRYDKAFLIVFDCCPPAKNRVNEYRNIDPALVAPHPVTSFRAIRSCVDPRKASKISKAKTP
jgi:hypothetical protein